MVRSVEVPPEGNRLALEEDEEEVESSEEYTSGNEDTDDPDLHPVDGDPE